MEGEGLEVVPSVVFMRKVCGHSCKAFGESRTTLQRNLCEVFKKIQVDECKLTKVKGIYILFLFES